MATVLGSWTKADKLLKPAELTKLIKKSHDIEGNDVIKIDQTLKYIIAFIL